MEPIAVVGVGCRFPQAPNLRALWDLLSSGRDVLGEIPAGRYPEFSDPDFARSEWGRRLSELRGGFLDSLDGFDPGVFQISPREACVVDPQQRLVLETAWEALEDAGQDFHHLVGARVGVYVGVWTNDYLTRIFRKFPQIDIAMTNGGGRHAASGRLSYALGLQGPSLTIDTACSSSLVAIHLACQAIRAGECELALAGGANVILDSSLTIAYFAAGALSPDGRCKFGDASADGYGRSEGAAVVVLKSLAKALADGDPIHAVIRGSAVSHNGQTGSSFLAPGEEGQLGLIRKALDSAGLGPEDLDYVEAHGTGTRVGDRMELRSLERLLSPGRNQSSSPCLIGSIKTNIGHTESAAGVAGLIKAILCLKHREVPPSLHLRNPNPDVPWNDQAMRIAIERTRLRDGGRPLTAGVNSFGITGTFAHVIVEEAPLRLNDLAGSAGGRGRTDGAYVPDSSPVLLPISARSRGALEAIAGAFASQVRSSPQVLGDVAFSAGVRRTHHELRVAAVGRHASSIADALDAFSRGETTGALCSLPDNPLADPKIGWVFTGQGPQWAGMGRSLFDHEPVFRATLEKLEPLIEAEAGWSLLGELSALGADSRLHLTLIAQPAIFSLQVALAELLASWGLRPAMVVGHSVGEAAAACVAGLLSLEDGVRLICARARIAEQANGLGKMAAVEFTPEEAAQLIGELGSPLAIAAVNGPRSLTVSGPEAAVHQFCEVTTARGRFNRVLDVNYPFHSALLDPLLGEMAAASEAIVAQDPHTHLYSTVHGRLATASDFTPAYWPRNLRETVQFAPAIQQMAAAGCNVFVEIGPHPALTYSIKQILNSLGHPGHAIETLRRESDGPADLLKTVGSLYVLGCDPDWRSLVPPTGRPVSLPTYAWQRESYWLDEQPGPAPSAPSKKGPTGLIDPLLQRSLRAMGAGGASFWESDISLEHFPWLADHRVQGRPVFPATAYLLPALKAAGRLSPGSSLADVELLEALFLPAGATISLQTAFHPADDDSLVLKVLASEPTRPEHAREHVRGRVVQTSAEDSQSLRKPATFLENKRSPQAQDAIYSAMRQGRLDYGPAFQGIATIQFGHNEALARLRLPSAVQADLAEYGIHPATFDACLQTLVTLTPGWSQSGDLWMPQSVANVQLRKLPATTSSLWAWASLTSTIDSTATETVGDVYLVDDSGDVLLAAKGVRLHKVERSNDFGDWLHEVRWKPRPLPPAARTNAASWIGSVDHLKPWMLAVEANAEERAAIQTALADLDRIGGLSIQNAIADLGFAQTPGRRFTADELMAETAIIPQHRRLVGRMLEILCEDGVLTRDVDHWRVVHSPNDQDLPSALRAASSRDPRFAAIWELFGRANLNLASALTGRVDAVELLFAGDGSQILEALYASAMFWLAPVRQIAHAVSAIVERLPEGQTIRVLEIGAGTGGLTSHVLPRLPAGRAEYHFTDLSRYFLTRATTRFASYPFLTGDLLDIERDPASQGFASGTFDLILASNCLHATRDLRQSLAHVRDLLAPGGCLLLQEETAVQRWTDLIFGLTDGWWRFDDHALRPNHPLLSPPAWVGLLESEGFTEPIVVGGEVSGSAVVAARRPATPTSVDPSAPTHSRWLLLADSGGVGQRLAEQLERLGEICSIVPPTATDSIATTRKAIASWLRADDVSGRTVVDLRPLDAVVNDMADAAALEAVEERAVAGFLALVQLLTESENSHPVRLALVTQGAQAAGGEPSPLALAQASLWGTSRVASLEHPRLAVRRIDLDTCSIEQQLESLAAELLSGDGETQVALRQGGRLVARLNRVDTPENDRLQLPTPSDHSIALKLVRRGTLDGINAMAEPRQAPGPREVEIRVAAAGVNFRDVLNALGAVDRVPLGLECSGTITAVGAEVRGFRVGDEVIAAGLGSWRTYFHTPAALVAAKPRQLHHEQAAALPIAYLTAHYALRHAAQLQPGQRVLIHSAAGGVGVAAVHLALSLGAQVYGTAGSAQKREYLRSLGVAHVFDSRTLDFADQIRAIDDGSVDVVLNCLNGEFIPKSLSVLGEHGHFVEIGKRDIWTASRMAENRPDVTYHVVELAEAMRSDPASLTPMLRQLAAEIAAGQIPTLPIQAFPLTGVVPALRFMQRGQHTGKLVLKVPTPIFGKSGSAAADLSDGTWLVTGWTGGLGLALSERLAERGARRLLLIARRAPQGPALALLDRLRERGVQVSVEVCDVADEEALKTALARGTTESSPLQGVFHLAGFLDDSPISQLNWREFANVFRPKVVGAWNLHRLTKDLPLECFVLFSSWTALLGSLGQASHTSANAALDALAHRRRALGLPGLSINWGAWREVGSAALPERLAHLARQGVGSLPSAEALDALAHVMNSDSIQVAVGPFDAGQWRATTAGDFAARFTEDLATATPSVAEKEEARPAISLREDLGQALTGPARRRVLEACVQKLLGQVLRKSSAKFDVRKPFKSLGLDSLTSLELRNHLEMESGLKLSAALVYNHATIANLATELAAQLGVSLEDEKPAPKAAAPAANPVADDELTALLSALEELPADEAMRLLGSDSIQGGNQ